MSSLSFLRSNRFVDDTVEDIIHSIDYVVTKTGLTQHRWSKSGECRECQRPGPQHWCIPYETRRLQRKFKKWTSGNDQLDEFIRQTQLAASSHTDYIEWIPFEKFHQVQKIGQGGFGVVYSAFWSDGPKWEWRQRTQRWGRKGRTVVALKCLHNSKNITKEFLDEIKLHHRSIIGEHIPRCYGITRSGDGDYILVMQYASEGSLRNFLNNKFSEIGWKDRLEMLTDIIDGLRLIHNTGLLHRDLHSGNILRHVDESDHVFTYIADLGLCNPSNSITEKRASFHPPTGNGKTVHGVLPYLAPEILRGDDYTKAADIYSFGVVMWEICSGVAPFENRGHNIHLAMDICKGLRPSVTQLSTTPKCYIELMERCWDANPEKRPDVQELRQTLDRFCTEFDENEFANAEKARLENSQDKESSSAPPVPRKDRHLQAIYTSRPLNFVNLPEPQNSSSYEPTNYEFIEFEEGDVDEPGKLELFMPQTGSNTPMLKIPEVKIDSTLFPLEDTLSQLSESIIEQDEY